VFFIQFFTKTKATPMSRLQSYPLEISKDKLWYRFISIGEAGSIIKLVNYEYVRSSLWNLAFGDANSDQTDFDDTTITDNGDMRKVMQTVFQTSLIFTDEYPDRKIFIEPVDRKRRLLYNRIFQDKKEEIEKFFTIEGEILGQIDNEPYSAQKMYDAFTVTRKPF
jgi:hypothetical protein